MWSNFRFFVTTRVAKLMTLSMRRRKEIVGGAHAGKQYVKWGKTSDCANVLSVDFGRVKLIFISVIKIPKQRFTTLLHC